MIHTNRKKDLAKKMNTTMADPIAGSSGMAIVNIASPTWQRLRNGLVKSPFEGFYSIA